MDSTCPDCLTHDARDRLELPPIKAIDLAYQGATKSYGSLLLRGVRANSLHTERKPTKSPKIEIENLKSWRHPSSFVSLELFQQVIPIARNVRRREALFNIEE